MKLGLLGYGRLGKLLSRYLSQDFDLVIYDPAMGPGKHNGFIFKSFEEVSAQPYVLLCVPISAMNDTLAKMAPHVKKGAVIIDTCSVKESPVEQMQNNLPADCSILGTHPMFGPDSAKDTLFGSKIVLCPERIDSKLLSEIKSYLNKHGLKVITCSATEHDKEISHSLVLTHFIGRALLEFGADNLEVDTKGYRRLMKILETVENDSWQLFEDMNHYNKYAAQTREKWLQALETIDKKVK